MNCNSKIAQLAERTVHAIVSIPDRDLDELQPLTSGSLAVFDFQGTVARVDHQCTVSATDLSRGKI